ncbi:hypothetical protein JCM10212_000308 [Sporobolomyces blumeae]
MTPLDAIVPPTLLGAIRAISLDNPVNVVLLSLLAYLVVSLVPATPTLPTGPYPTTPNAGAYNWRPADHKPSTVWRTFTPTQLARYDGTDPTLERGRILFAIRRKVYDVTSGRSFYGPGGPYEVFAGRDASRGLAKQSFDKEMLTPLDEPIDALSDLSEGEWKALVDWEGHFGTKYFQCG